MDKGQQLKSAIEVYSELLTTLKYERNLNPQLCCNSSAEIEDGIEKEIVRIKKILENGNFN